MIALLRLIAHVKRAPELIAAWRETPAFREVVLRYLDSGSRAYPYEIPLSGGGRLTVSSPEEVRVFWQIFVRRCYQIPIDSRTIVDVGANIGLFSVWAARALGSARITALEPFPDTFRVLEKNIRANHLDSRVRTLELGLAAECGERLMRSDGGSPNRRLLLKGSDYDPQSTIVVRCLTLTDFLQNEGLKTVDLLKMDIEGGEWEVLFSTPVSVLRTIRHIRLEYHEVNARFAQTPEKLFAHLADAGHWLTHREEDVYKTGMAYFDRR